MNNLIASAFYVFALSTCLKAETCKYKCVYARRSRTAVVTAVTDFSDRKLSGPLSDGSPSRCSIDGNFAMTARIFRVRRDSAADLLTGNMAGNSFSRNGKIQPRRQSREPVVQALQVPFKRQIQIRCVPN